MQFIKAPWAFFQQMLFSELAGITRLKYYAAFYAFTFLSVPFLHVYNGVALNVHETLIHGFMISFGIIPSVLLLELLGWVIYRHHHWSLHLSVWQLWVLISLLSLAGALIFQNPTPIFEATQVIANKHEKAGLGDNPIYGFAIQIVILYLGTLFILRDQLLIENKVLSRINDSLKSNIVPEAVPNTEGADEGDFSTTLEFKQDGEEVSVQVGSVEFINVEENYCHIWVLQNDEEKLKRVIVRSTLASLLERLPQNEIIQCHRSYAVNTQKIDRIIKDQRNYALVLHNTKEIIPVSRSQSEKILACLKRGL